ncbi:hypothetical protein PQX77_004698 [Marasmius sp. AFHP31]|nr:hypothetical protein PQX77_004698 [Marasmius sp. AFHP31]
MAKHRRVASRATSANSEKEKGLGSGETKKRKLVRRQGVLRYIKEVPLDVLFEIFSYLEPLDLLRLSRTSKDLRRILISRSSSSVWKAAREHLQVPDPARSMSEPKLANLLFDSHYHFCLVATVHNIIWTAASRCCKSCLPKHFASAQEIRSRGFLTRVQPEIWHVLPDHELRNGSMGRRQWRGIRRVYLVSAAEEFHSHMNDVTDIWPVQWFSEMLKDIVSKLQSMNECKRWMDRRIRAREKELLDVREARYDAILSRLSASGWEEEEEECITRQGPRAERRVQQELTFPEAQAELREHKLVNQPKALTDKIWQNIQGPLSALMNSLKAARLQRERTAMSMKRYIVISELIKQQQFTLPRGVVIPPFLDVALWEPIRSVIEDLPNEAGAERSLFDEAISGLRKFILEWNRERSQEMLCILQKRKPDATEADLHRAASLFCCGRLWCAIGQSILPYPAVLSHSCSDGSLVGFITVLPPWAATLNRRCFSDAQLTADSNAIRCTETVARLHGLDPSSTSFTEMLATNPIVECRICSVEEGFRVFWRWSRACFHSSNDHRTGERPVYILGSAEDTARVASHDGWVPPAQTCQDKPWYLCKQCGLRGTRATVEGHITEKHGVQSVTEEDWDFEFLGALEDFDPLKPTRLIPAGTQEVPPSMDCSDLYFRTQKVGDDAQLSHASNYSTTCPALKLDSPHTVAPRVLARSSRGTGGVDTLFLIRTRHRTGGTAGSVLANRLTEDLNTTVLVVEAGINNANVQDIIVPFLGPNAVGTAVDWNFTISPQRELFNRTFPLPRGHVLGGSSSINFMTWNRGSDDVWDNFARLSGDPGWSWESVEKYNRKASRLTPPQDGHDTTGQVIPAAHDNGEVLTSLPGFPTDLDPIVTDTAKALGKYNRDFNAGDMIGFGMSVVLFRTRLETVRSSAATAYLAPALKRPNLDVVINSRVTKVFASQPSLDGEPVINAVQIAPSESGICKLLSGPPSDCLPVLRCLGSRLNVTASREVILSAGAFGTPQLLLLSGIGPKDELSKLEIPVILDSPDVGKHLTDHPLVTVYYEVNSNTSFDPVLRSESTMIPPLLEQWGSNRTGLLVVPRTGGTAAFLKNPPGFLSGQDPSSGPRSGNIEIIFVNGFTASVGSVPFPSTGRFLTVVTAVVSPTSRGGVTLRSTNPFDDPVIDPGLYTTEFDMQTMVQAMKIDEFVHGPRWNRYIKKPLVQFENDQDRENYARNNSGTVNHPVGTARMGPGGVTDGVVDSSLRVKGVKGLRVIDASVFPQIPENHPQAVVYIVAERASDLIKSQELQAVLLQLSSLLRCRPYFSVFALVDEVTSGPLPYKCHSISNSGSQSVRTSMKNPAKGFNMKPDIPIGAGKLGLLTSHGEAQTMSLHDIALHGKLEHDASLSREDIAIGDHIHSNETTFPTLLNSNPGSEVYNMTSAGQVMHARLADSLSRNPNVTNTDFQEGTRAGESGFCLSVMGDLITGEVPKKHGVQSVTEEDWFFEFLGALEDFDPLKPTRLIPAGTQEVPPSMDCSDLYL